MIRLHRYCLPLLFALLALLAQSAHAGNIAFGLSLTGTKLTLINQGNASAFYPAVFRLLENGQWQRLPLPPGANQPAELAAGATFEFVWPDQRPREQLPPLESLRTIMVRFFDQAGAGFGQISFFNQPMPATDTLQAGYEHGLMTITPPTGNSIRASWLLWPQEEGIGPLTGAVSFEHQQPNARRIEWRPGMEKLRMSLGGGQPTAFLMHETAQGLTFQTIYDGGVQGRQQRTAWLNASRWFFGVTYGLLAAAILLLGWSLNNKRRGGAA
ncbi:MAG: hypothetical protein HYS18_06745 [Burkholderiales bacterium]|nr:hypothetical protein [Burkholderiales bacterium]